jgi:hypothetical protein
LTRWILAPFARFMHHADDSADHGAEKEKQDRRRSAAATGRFDLEEYHWVDAIRRCIPYITRTSRRKATVIIVLLLLWCFATNRESLPSLQRSRLVLDQRLT